MSKEKSVVKYFPVDRTKDSIIENSEYLREKRVEEDLLCSMIDTLYDCYSKNKTVTISYFENGAYHHYSGVIAKIDVLNEQIILLPKKKINIQNISKITAKN